MKNLSEALGNLDGVIYEECGNLEITGGEIIDGTVEPIKRFLKSTLISLLDEVVMKSNINRNDDEQFKRGWNDCRQELIKKINEIKK